MRLGDALSQSLGKETVNQRSRDFVVVVEDSGQSLNAVPHGVVAIFQSDTRVVGKLWQLGGERWGSGIDVEWLSLDYGRDCRQYRKHHLLAVAKVASGGLDAESYERDGVRNLPVNFECVGSAGCDVLIEGSARYHFIGARIEQFNNCIAGKSLFGGVLHTCRQLCDVALTQEAWNARFNHQGLVGEHFLVQFVGVEVAVVGNGLHNPGGVEVWSVELKTHIALSVAHKHRFPQSHFHVALTQLHLLKCGFVDINLRRPCLSSHHYFIKNYSIFLNGSGTSNFYSGFLSHWSGSCRPKAVFIGNSHVRFIQYCSTTSSEQSISSVVFKEHLIVGVELGK